LLLGNFSANLSDENPVLEHWAENIYFPIACNGWFFSRNPIHACTTTELIGSLAAPGEPGRINFAGKHPYK
jgi:hypothetical protein